MFQDRDKNKTASRRPHTCQTNHTHTVPRRKRPIYFWLLQYNKVYISERKTATASSLLECLTRAKPLTSDQKGKTQFILAFLQVQTAKYISERKTATASRMPHTCQTSHSHKEDPKHKILVLHNNIFTAKFRYQVFISFRLKYPYEQGLHLMFQDRDKNKTASRRPHTCQTKHSHTVSRRKRSIYFWLLQYKKVYISERKTATASSLLEGLTCAKPLTAPHACEVILGIFDSYILTLR